jgi:hypothetical protein
MSKRYIGATHRVAHKYEYCVLKKGDSMSRPYLLNIWDYLTTNSWL